MPNPFHRFEHRSHDLAAARAFYDDVLDGLPWGDVFSLAPLPERAKAAGAPPHWLGHVGVEDVALTGQRLEERGAQRLGPPAFRDPFGAIVAHPTVVQLLERFDGEITEVEVHETKEGSS